MRILIGMALLASAAFGQLTLTNGGFSAGSGDLISSSNITWNGSCFYSSDGTTRCPVSPVSLSQSWNSGVPTETRKPNPNATTLLQVKASAHHILESRLAPADYITVAKRIGIDSTPIEEAQLLDLIHRKDLKVFDYSRVDDYLYNQALKMGTNTRWVWKPVRDADMKLAQPHATWSTRAGMGFIYPTVYAKAIPQRILEQIEDLLCDKEIDGLIFLVSDFEVIKPDPFLAITTAKLLEQGKIFIIAQWDEPSFTDSEPSVKPAGTKTVATR
jgi:hypothetical protein